jgi:hypothetical protein
VGLFTNNDEQTHMNGDYYGLFAGGGGHLLGVQALAALCIFAWSAATTLIVFLVRSIESRTESQLDSLVVILIIVTIINFLFTYGTDASACV